MGFSESCRGLDKHPMSFLILLSPNGNDDLIVGLQPDCGSALGSTLFGDFSEAGEIPSATDHGDLRSIYA